MAVHSGEKPFKCAICQRGFARLLDLYAHKAVHSGEKPHQCEVCGVGYISKNGLKYHNRTKHNIISEDGETTSDSAEGGESDATALVRETRCKYARIGTENNK